jgi:poly(A) polymerase
MPIQESVQTLSLTPVVKSILRHLQGFFASRQIETYVVGGLPRDLLLQQATRDIDLAIGADALALGTELARELPARAVVLDEGNRVVRLVLTEPLGWQVDLASLQGSLQQDLERRDFTLNALAIDLGLMTLGDDPEEVTIIDPLGGLMDVQNKIIRAASTRVFQEDGIRLLRGVRLAAELNFTIAAETASLMRRDARQISAVAGERVREELLRLLALSGTADTLYQMQELGLVTALIPEMEPAIGLEQPHEHYWDVFNHSLESVGATDFVLRRGTWAYADPAVLQDVPWNDELEKYFNSPVGSGSTRRELLKLAALLHDIAKPQTKVLTPDLRTRFFGHPEQGAPVAVTVLERLRFASREIRLVACVVRYHLRPTQAGHQELPTPRAIYRFFRDLSEGAVDTLFFSLADHLAARGPNLDLTNWRWHANMVTYMLAAGRQQEKAVSPAWLVNGCDLQRALGMAPGPALGRLLAAAHEAQAAGEIANRDEALVYINNLMAPDDKAY